MLIFSIILFTYCSFSTRPFKLSCILAIFYFRIFSFFPKSLQALIAKLFSFSTLALLSSKFFIDSLINLISSLPFWTYYLELLLSLLLLTSSLDFRIFAAAFDASAWSRSASFCFFSISFSNYYIFFAFSSTPWFNSFSFACCFSIAAYIPKKEVFSNSSCYLSLVNFYSISWI